MSRLLLVLLLTLALCPVLADSLWTASSTPLYTDTRARAVGDLLTVIIVQQSSANTTSSHNTAKGTNVSSEAGSGWLGSFPGFGVKADRTTTGTGTAATSTQLTDRLTVQVKEVLPNGNLRVEGSRNLQLEKDEMILVFSGIVRQEDIAPDNSISSIQVAELNLDVKGTGPIAEKQRPGLLSRLLSLLW